MRPAVPFAVLAAACLLAACSDETDSASPASSSSTCQNDIRTCMDNRTTPPPMTIDTAATYTAVVHTNRGDFTLKLDPKAAPVTVNNFVYLAQNHFYDGLTFHRVEPGFVVQGGDPGNGPALGSGGPANKLPNETNPAPWNAGSVGMASSQAGVNGSQFFVLIGDAPWLSQGGVYNHFGVITAGLDVVKAIHVGDTMSKIEVTKS